MRIKSSAKWERGIFVPRAGNKNLLFIDVRSAARRLFQERDNEQVQEWPEEWWDERQVC